MKVIKTTKITIKNIFEGFDFVLYIWKSNNENAIIFMIAIVYKVKIKKPRPANPSNPNKFAKPIKKGG